MPRAFGESHQTHHGAASRVIPVLQMSSRVSHHWAFSPSELDSAEAHQCTKDFTFKLQNMIGWMPTKVSENHWHRDAPSRSRGRDPRAGWVCGGVVRKVLQTLYLLSVTCLRRGIRLVQLVHSRLAAGIQLLGCVPHPAQDDCHHHTAMKSTLCSKWLFPGSLGKLGSPFLLQELDCRSQEGNR